MFRKIIISLSVAAMLAMASGIRAQDANSQIAQAAATGNASKGGASQASPDGAPATGAAPAEPGIGNGNVKVNLRIMKMVFSNTLRVSMTDAKAARKTKENIILWYKNGIGDMAKWKSIEINEGEATQKMDYEGPSKLVFYVRKPAASPELPPIYTELCDTVIPENAKDMYLLMFKTGDNISFYSMNVSPTSLPRGKTVLVNMTQYPLLVSLGGAKPFLLNRGRNVICAAKKTDENDAELILAWRVGKTWERCARTTVPMSSDDTRTVLLAYRPDKDAKHLNVTVLNY